MPYFNHSMAQSMRKTSKEPQKEQKKVQLRSMPGSQKVVSKNADPQFTKKYTQKVSKRKLLFNRSLLKAQVCFFVLLFRHHTFMIVSPYSQIQHQIQHQIQIDQLNDQQTTFPVDKAKQLFDTYQIDTSNKLYEDEDHQIFPAKNTLQPEFAMVVLIYPKQKLDPKNSFFLKVLRHLGRKHPYIVNTWEMFHDDEQVYIFQEYVSKGNLITYLENNEVNEPQVCFWAKQIYRALDFLGDNGIAHRDINPHHLMIKPMGREVWVKLTGFKNAVIYWNFEENDVNFLPCIPIAQQKNDGPNFQAPEVYGNPNEHFDPILADTWSYGANLFFSLAQFYPYNIEYPHEDLDEEIWHNILKIPNISQECQQFLFSLMRANANDRIPFDFIDKDPWIGRSYTMQNRDVVARSTYKHLEKVKFKGDIQNMKFSTQQQPKTKQAPPPSPSPAAGSVTAAKSSKSGSIKSSGGAPKSIEKSSASSKASAGKSSSAASKSIKVTTKSSSDASKSMKSQKKSSSGVAKSVSSSPSSGPSKSSSQ